MGAIFRKMPLGVKVVGEKYVSSSDSICGQFVARSSLLLGHGFHFFHAS